MVIRRTGLAIVFTMVTSLYASGYLAQESKFAALITDSEVSNLSDAAPSI